MQPVKTGVCVPSIHSISHSETRIKEKRFRGNFVFPFLGKKSGKHLKTFLFLKRKYSMLSSVTPGIQRTCVCVCGPAPLCHSTGSDSFSFKKRLSSRESCAQKPPKKTFKIKQSVNQNQIVFNLTRTTHPT